MQTRNGSEKTLRNAHIAKYKSRKMMDVTILNASHAMATFAGSAWEDENFTQINHIS